MHDGRPSTPALIGQHVLTQLLRAPVDRVHDAGAEDRAAAGALGAAVGLVKASGATMKLIQVSVPIPTYVYTGSVYGGMSYIDPAWDEEALASARTYVESIVKRLRDTGVQADGEARRAPNVTETIVTMADEVEADLIVMSTQALRGPARALMGSVADAVVRRAHCPILLLHRDEPASVAYPSTQTEAAQPAHAPATPAS